MNSINDNTYVSRVPVQMQSLMKKYFFDEYLSLFQKHGFFKKSMSLVRMDFNNLNFIEIKYYPTHGYRDFDVIISLGSFFCDGDLQMSSVVKSRGSGTRISLIYNTLKYSNDYSYKLNLFDSEAKKEIINALSNSPNEVEIPYSTRVQSSLIIFEKLLLPIISKIDKLTDFSLIKQELLSSYSPYLNVPDKEDLYINIYLGKYEEAKNVLESLLSYYMRIFNENGVTFFDNADLFKNECKRVFDEEMNKMDIKILNPVFNFNDSKYYKIYLKMKSLIEIKEYLLNSDYKELTNLTENQILRFKQSNEKLFAKVR